MSLNLLHKRNGTIKAKKQPADAFNKTINHVANTLYMNPHDVLRQSLKCFLERKLFHIRAELSTLQDEYKVQTAKEFELFYKTGAIPEETTRSDFHKFEDLENEREVLHALIDEFN